MSEPDLPAEKGGSSSARGEEEATPSAAAAPRRPGRWTDTLTGALLCVAVAVVAVSASPALLRAAGVVDLRPEAGAHAGGRLSLLPPGHERPRRPLFEDEDEDEDALTPPFLESKRERGILGDRGKPREEAEERGPRVHAPEGPLEGADGTSARIGVVRHRITLVESPGEDGPTLGEVQPGKLVMVLKEAGDFALVAYSSEDGIVMGWTKKSEIAVR
jgi:hypothetical protein